MKLIEPMPVKDAELTASNISENEHPVWDAVTSFAKDDRVIVTGTTHKVYESVQSGNSNHDPTTDDGSWWLEISATNKWKAFDLKIADRATKAGTITYSIEPTRLVTGIAFFGLNAGTVRVQIYDDTVVEIFDQTVDLVDETDVADWFTFFFSGVVYDTEALFVGVPGYTGFRIDVTIDASTGDAEVGQIVLGTVHELGTTLDGTAVGIEDFSTKDRDDFGNATIVERAFVDETTFQFMLPTQDARRVKRVLSRVRATPSVYFADTDMAQYGATVFGFFQDFDIPLNSGGTSFATLEIEGLV